MTESNRNSLMLAGDAIRRSLTRNSHYSHASTHSWVLSNQQNPPPPPPDEPLPSPARTSRPLPDRLPSPGRTPRPLPDPQLQGHHHQLQTTNAEHIPETPEDEEEYMNIDPNFPGLEGGYLTQGLGRGRPSITDVPTEANASSRREGGFVGGFVNGLRRLPRVVLKHRSFGDKRKYFRRATYGSGGTLTNATFTNGTDTVNTLPLYATNPPTPVAGPSNTRYIEALEMPVPHPPEPPTPLIQGPSLSQRRHHPSFRVSPPSEEAADHRHHTEPPVAPVQPSPPAVPGHGSNTVTVYNLPEQEDYRAEEPALPLPVPTPNRLSNSQSQNPRSPAASIPAEVHTQSPVLVRPPHTSDYRKMTLSSSPRSPGTMSTSLNSEPSFSSQLSPVKSFLVKLYRLPWIAPERVTDDYRPGRDARHGIAGGVKKPMTSWYRGTPGVVLSVKNGSGEVDLLSSNSSSMRASTRASTGTSSIPTSSPGLRVRNRSSDHQRTHHREPRHHTHHADYRSRNQGRSHHQRTVSTSTDFQPQTNSPMIPAVYPYPYPFPVPYPTFSTQPPPPLPQRTQSQSMPRGPRPHRTQSYPHGYVPYQPPQPPPSVFLMQTPAQSASSVDHSHAPTQVMSPVYVPMSLVPGALPQETAQQTTHVASAAVSPPVGETVTVGGA